MISIITAVNLKVSSIFVYIIYMSNICCLKFDIRKTVKKIFVYLFIFKLEMEIAAKNLLILKYGFFTNVFILEARKTIGTLLYILKCSDYIILFRS